jgi:uncharacterized repeat protein (TIGR02543 family)
MKKLKSSSVLTVYLAIMFLALGLAIVSCGGDSVPLYRVLYHAGEGKGVPPYPRTVGEGHIIELPDQDTMAHPTGKVLSGWKSSTNGVIYNPYDRYPVYQDVSFTAQWSVSGSKSPGSDTGTGPVDPPTTVIFNINGGSGNIPDPMNGAPGSRIYLPSGDGLSKNGYTFGGWNTNAAGTGTNYNAGSSYTIPNKDTTLYAIWNPNPGGGGKGDLEGDTTGSQGGAYGTQGGGRPDNGSGTTDGTTVPRPDNGTPSGGTPSRPDNGSGTTDGTTVPRPDNPYGITGGIPTGI